MKLYCFGNLWNVHNQVGVLKQNHVRTLDKARTSNFQIILQNNLQFMLQHFRLSIAKNIETFCRLRFDLMLKSH